MDESDGGVVFLIFALPDLDKVLTGRKAGGIVEDLLGVSRSTADRLARPSKSLELLERFSASPDEELSQYARKIQTGEFPYHASVPLFLHAAIEDVWQDYERSFRLFHFAEQLEFASRAKFGRLQANDLICMVLGLNASGDVGAVLPEAESHRFPLPDQFEGYLRDSRPQVVCDFFFDLMAALDLDLYSSLYGSYMPRMIFPAVMPEFIEEAIKPYVERPLRRLLNLCYCSVMDCDRAPSLEDMVAPYDLALWVSTRGKLERGTVSLDVILSLTRAWLNKKPEARARFEARDDADGQRRYGMLLILNFGARIFDFVFEPVRKRRDCPDLINAFGARYYRAWQRELARRGLAEAVGRPWDDRPLTRLIGGSYVLK